MREVREVDDMREVVKSITHRRGKPEIALPLDLITTKSLGFEGGGDAKCK